MKKITGLKIFVFLIATLVMYGAISYVEYILLLKDIKYITSIMLCGAIVLVPYGIGSGEISKWTVMIPFIAIAASISFGVSNVYDNKTLILYDKDVLATAIKSLHIVIPLVAFICGVLEERKNKNKGEKIL